MTLPDWRSPCEHGRYDFHRGTNPSGFRWEKECPGGSPLTYADLEALGEKVWWCGQWGQVFEKELLGCGKIGDHEHGWRLLIPFPTEAAK